ncbi:MAG TPA: hypothetical protein VFJ85_17390 [Acidimicrobiales bacterium]|nr:hypothetical protein [Acidimicrobiales bacterium]
MIPGPGVGEDAYVVGVAEGAGTVDEVAAHEHRRVVAGVERDTPRAHALVLDHEQEHVALDLGHLVTSQAGRGEARLSVVRRGEGVEEAVVGDQ